MIPLARQIAWFALALVMLPAAALGQSQTSGPIDRDKADTLRIQRYLNSITTFKADFTQIGPKGGVAQGVIYISRPGRLRVQYKPPAKLLIVATRVFLIVYDGEYDGVQHIPLRANPAGILIQKDLKLSGKIKVLGFNRGGATIAIRLGWTDAPERGKMIIRFIKEPLSLLGWSVVDARGRSTRVIFENIKTGIKLDDKLFKFIRPTRKGPTFNDGSR